MLKCAFSAIDWAVRERGQTYFHRVRRPVRRGDRSRSQDSPLNRSAIAARASSSALWAPARTRSGGTKDGASAQSAGGRGCFFLIERTLCWIHHGGGCRRDIATKSWRTVGVLTPTPGEVAPLTAACASRHPFAPADADAVAERCPLPALSAPGTPAPHQGSPPCAWLAVRARGERRPRR